MEFIVRRHEFFEVAGLRELLLARDRGIQLGVQCSIRLQRQQAHDLQLQRLTQEMRLLRAMHVDAAHHRCVLRKYLDQTFLVEAHQRIADRRRTDAELFGERGARQRRSRRQLQRNDHAAQAVEHLRRGLTVAVEPGGGAGGRAFRRERGLIHRNAGMRRKRLATDALIH